MIQGRMLETFTHRHLLVGQLIMTAHDPILVLRSNLFCRERTSRYHDLMLQTLTFHKQLNLLLFPVSTTLRKLQRLDMSLLEN